MNKDEFQSKRMLLISTLFFGYYKEIIAEAQNLGLDVDFVCDAPSNSNISKAIGRVNKKFIELSTRKYFKNEVLPKIQNVKYDYVLVIASMTFALTPNMIKQIRENNPDAKFIIYQWDAEKNISYVTKIHQFFDKVYTFDRFDCINNNVYNFLPLFYINRYESIGKITEEFDYDCLYVGTAHPKKYKEINEISSALKKVYKKQKIYHYMPSFLKFIYHKLLNYEYKNAKLSDFEREKLSTDELIKLFSSSKTILDAPQAGQYGLTMRTIECLGAKRKLITTNKDIVNYDFYDDVNILVFDENFDVNSPFFTQGYKELPVEIYEKYSLRNWLKVMLI